MKAIGRKAVFIYSGLDVILQITSVDPLEQIYYAGSDSFIPDRTLTPLVLTPKAQVKDKKGISMPSELANVAWYIGTPDEKNRVTSRTQTDDYYLDGLNLVVRKNLEVPQQIYVKAEYLDTRTKTTITIPQVVQLSISKSSEIAPAPTCSIDRPSDWSINPLKDAAIQDLAATIFKDEKAYRGAVKWNKSFNGIKSEIVEKDDFYISGQLTNSLKIDTDKLPSGVLIGCENPSEEFYNKVYGINPDWDSKMQEVFALLAQKSVDEMEIGGRNLVGLFSDSYTGSNAANGYGSYFIRDGYEFSAKTRYPAFAYKVIVPPSTTLTLSLDLEIDMANPEALFQMISNRAGGGTEALSPNIKKSGRYTFTFLSNANGEDNRIGFIAADNTAQTSIKVSNVKLEKGNKATPWTPAPEDLNYLNLVINGSSKSKEWQLNESKLIVGNYYCVTSKVVGDFKIGEQDIKSNVAFKLDAKSDKMTSEIDNENICLYALPGDYELELPFQPSPYDYAPDGIIKGEYEADVPMFVKYPDTLDISMKPLPLIPEGVEELELEVEATTSAGTLNNPAKYFDIDYYLSNDEEAGVEPVKVGSGNSVKVTREQLKERPEYYLEWDYKKRPTTLNKKQSQSIDK